MGSAELLKVHGLWDQSSGDFNKKTVNEEENKNLGNSLSSSPTLNGSKKIKRIQVPKPVTATISPAFPPLRPSSRNSPKAGPSNRIESPISVKVEEANFSDEENHPEHVVIPSDPNSIGGSFFINYYTDFFLSFLILRILW